MNQKTVVITGATSGIGKACALELAKRGANIIGVSRDPEKCRRAAEEINAATQSERATFLTADLSLQTEVRRVAAEILDRVPRLDVLLNNVGAAFFRRSETPEGIERTFALNHLSYFLLTHLLLERLIESRPARIINVSSSAQFHAEINFDDINRKRKYRVMEAYGQSKLGNMLFTYSLAEKLGGRGVTVNGVHPGFVRTNMGRDNGFLGKILQPLITLRARTPEQGAKSLVFLASNPELDTVTGKYFVDEKAVPSADASYDEETMQKLWDLSVKMVGL